MTDEGITTSLASDAILAVQRLHQELKRSHPPLSVSSEKLISELISIKSQLERVSVDSVPLALKEHDLAELKRVVQQVTPETLTADHRNLIQNLIEKELKTSSVSEIHLIALHTCPFHALIEPDHGRRARHSVLFVVFQWHSSVALDMSDEHSKESRDSIELDWLHVIELSQFCSMLVRAKLRWLETVFFTPKNVISHSPQWPSFLAILPIHSLLRGKSFIEQCRGQLIGRIAKKHPKLGHLKLLDSVKMADLINSLKMIFILRHVLHEHTPTLQTVKVDDSEFTVDELDVIQLLRTNQEHNQNFQRIFEKILSLKQSIDDVIGEEKTFAFANDVDRSVIEKWMYEERTRQAAVIERTELAPEDPDSIRVEELLDRVGPEVRGIPAKNVIMIARGGSYSYNLLTESSDADYVVVYCDDPVKAIGHVGFKKEVIQSQKGPECSVEFTAYEARLFAELLAKGSVLILELLFRDDVEYESDLWRQLKAQRCHLVNEHAIMQFFGLVRNNVHLLETKQAAADEKRKRKIFYHIFHKMWSLEYLLDGKVPPVRCVGEVRDKIMRIREGVFDEHFNLDSIKQEASARLKELWSQYLHRPRRLVENVPRAVLNEWLFQVRRIAFPAVESTT